MFSCLLAAPEVELENLASHLADRLALYGPRGSIDMLRYHDPRVFRHLWRILPPERLCTLYGPVTEWTIRLEGKWISLPAPEVAGLIPKFWGVKEPQYAQLDRIIHLNGILDRRKQQQGRPWRDLDDYHEAARAADKALDIAQNRYRLSQTDSASFVLHALEHGERFYLHPVIQRLLHAAWNKEMPYTASASKIDAQGWAIIEAESFRLYE
jgi:hypothetical protein